MSEHTPEPWHVGGKESSTIYDKFGQRIANSFEGVMATQRTGAQCTANARRIVACVNACKDIPTEVLEVEMRPGFWGGATASACRKLDAMTAQRNELLLALDHLRKAFIVAVGDKSPFAKCALAPADASIANAKGESV